MLRPEANRYVPLDRTFHELSRYAGESDDSDLSQAFSVSDALTWNQLLAEHRVVILSEAGSGKTEEIRQVASRLRSDDKDAFFLRLENIPSHFENAFEVGSYAEFGDWLSSGREGWLLLDSVDEARLRHPQDFELAIKLLGDQIRLALDRSHLVLTGRISAWRPKTDLDLCKRYLPYTQIEKVADLAATPPQSSDYSPAESSDFDSADGDQPERIPSTSSKASKENPAAPFRIVTLDNLDPPRVKKFVQESGVADVDGFMKAISKADAWHFTTRPQDLEDLIALWLDESRIGGRLEIMRNGISRRLKEPDQNRDDAFPLSTDKATYGARLLAAATTLGRNPAIQVPGGAYRLEGIPAEKVLPTWDARERKAILDRAIFDAPAYDAVRFHHRTVREYLAADWLLHLLTHPASRRAIESLLFRTQYDVEIVVPTTRPLLPWLALFDERIRERVRSIAPEVLFEGGDPAKLPLETRRQVLKDVTAEIATNYTPRAPTNQSAAQRFANVDLTDDIRELLEKYKTNDEAVSFLLRMVWQGQIKGALSEAKNVALRSDGGKYRRVAAIRALHEIAPEQLIEVREALLRETPPIKRDWLAEVVSVLGDSKEELDWLIAALGLAEPPERFHVDLLSDALSRFVEAAGVESLSRLATALDELLSQSPYIDQRYARVSKANSWLLEAAVRTAERLIVGRATAALSLEVLRTLHAIGTAHNFDTDVRELKTGMADLVPSWPELNRALFWFEVEAARQSSRGENRITSPWQVSIFGAFWKFDADDFEYLCGQVAERPSVDDKLIALSLAYDAYVLAGRPKHAYDLLKNTVSADNAELTRRFQTLINPPPRSQQTPQEARWKKQARVRERVEKANKRKSVEYIRSNVESVRDPKFPNPDDISRTQWYLHHQTRDASEHSGKWTTGEWKTLVPTFGEEVALAYREGAIIHWRRANPKVRSEGSPANQTSASIIFGLTGLAIEARETVSWASGLSVQDAMRACRYASHELNGFPEWLPSLFESHPQVVADFLMQELTFEVNEGPEEGMHYIIDDLAWSGQWAWSELGPRILRLLESNEPRNGETLDKLIQMILGSGIDDNEISTLAQLKATALPRNPHCAQWFSAWTGVSPDEAIPSFEDYLSALDSDDARVDAAMTFVTRLFGDRRSDYRIARDKFKAPAHLKALYQLMHRYIRRADDIDRANGGVYSPNLRDHAQDARNAILNVLEGIQGKESYVAMKELAEAEEDDNARRWILFRAQRRAEHDGDLQAWSPEQVREFSMSQERTPGSHRELAELAVGRLLDLKDDLENGDSSIASILRNVTGEDDMRLFIGRELREKAAGRYSIPQEEELADAKRPDLRFHGAGIDTPVAVELKLADKWTGPELFERFENQLSAAYLRDRRSLHGIYVLMNQGTKRFWELPTGMRVDFQGLVNALTGHWQALAPRFPRVDEVAVIGIDLTRRLS